MRSILWWMQGLAAEDSLLPRVGVADVLDLIQKFLRLATSNPEENEARNSAVKAAKLIMEHKVVLSLPGQAPAPRPVSSSQWADPVPPRPEKSSAPRKVKDIHGVTWLFHEDGPKFGGHCLFCALPMMRGQAAYVGDLGLLHVVCWNERQDGKLRPGPAPKPAARPAAVPDPRNVAAETAAVDDLWSKINPR